MAAFALEAILIWYSISLPNEVGNFADAAWVERHIRREIREFFIMCPLAAASAVFVAPVLWRGSRWQTFSAVLLLVVPGFYVGWILYDGLRRFL
jgi:hypothetical protein